VSDTTLHARRAEWIDASVFDALKTEALAVFDRVISRDLDDVALDGSLQKARYGGEGTGPNPTDRAKPGWKWSVPSERHGIPVGWDIDGANGTTSPCSNPHPQPPTAARRTKRLGRRRSAGDLARRGTALPIR
jgi:hypothetical protein